MKGINASSRKRDAHVHESYVSFFPVRKMNRNRLPKLPFRVNAHLRSRDMATPTAKPKNRLAPYLKTMLAKVRPGWQRVLNSPTLKPRLHDAIRGLDKYLYDHGVTDALLEKYGLDYFILPAHANVLAAFHYFDPQNLVAILMGQDPYPGMGSSSTNGIDASGMCFSVAEGRAVPSSLRNVYQALMKNKDEAGKPLLKSLPESGNLVNWARQGMLMLNYYLTRSTKFTVAKNTVTINGSGNADNNLLHTFWAPFTETLLTYLTTTYLNKQLNHSPHYIGVMLWGAQAKALERCIQTRMPPLQVEVMNHGHPSGLSTINSNHEDPKAFVNCPHFSALVKKVPGFVWDPRIAPTEKPSRLAQFYSLLQFLPVGETEVAPELLTKLLEQDIAYNDGTTEPNNTKIKIVLHVKAEAAKALAATEKELDEPMTAEVTPTVKTPAAAAATDTTNDIWIALASDGGCEGNGARVAAKSKASYAVAIPETFLGHRNAIYDYLNPVENGVRLTTNGTVAGPVPRFAITADRNFEFSETAEAVQPSNGRGELLGGIHAMRLVYRYLRHLAQNQGFTASSLARVRIMLICDATYVLHFVNERMWKYRLKAASKKGGNWLDTVVANRDLVEILGNLTMEIAKLRGGNVVNVQACWDSMLQPGAHDYYRTPVDMDVEWRGLTVVHQRSHQQVPDNDTQFAKERWAMNKSADEAAGALL